MFTGGGRGGKPKRVLIASCSFHTKKGPAHSFIPASTHMHAVCACLAGPFLPLELPLTCGLPWGAGVGVYR